MSSNSFYTIALPNSRLFITANASQKGLGTTGDDLVGSSFGLAIGTVSTLIALELTSGPLGWIALGITTVQTLVSGVEIVMDVLNFDEYDREQCFMIGREYTVVKDPFEDSAVAEPGQYFGDTMYVKYGIWGQSATGVNVGESVRTGFDVSVLAQNQSAEWDPVDVHTTATFTQREGYTHDLREVKYTWTKPVGW